MSRPGLALVLLAAGCTVGLDLGAHDRSACPAGTACDGGGDPQGDGGTKNDGSVGPGGFGPEGILPDGPWVAAARGLEGGDLRSVAHDASNPSVVYAASWGAGIFRSKDAGQTWTPASSGLGDRMCITRLVAHSARAGVVFALVGECDRRGEPFQPAALAIFRTTDGAATWSPVASAIAAGLLDESSTVAASESAPDTVYVKTRVSVWRSTDGGSTFTSRSRLDGPTGPTDALVIDPVQKDVVYMIHGGALWRSTDGGAVFAPLPTPISPTAAEVEQLLVSHVDPQVLHTSRRYADSFATSRDGGATWQPRPAPGLYGGRMSACPTDAKRFYLSTPDRLFGTTDEWASVMPIGATPPFARSRTRTATGLQAVSVDPRACDAVVFAGDLVWRSADGGRTITEAQGITNLDIDALAMAPSSSEVMFAGSLAKLYRTADGGRQWARVQAVGLPEQEDITAIAVHPANADTLYVASYDVETVPKTPRAGHVYKSIDGGRTLAPLDLRGAMPTQDGGTRHIDKLMFAPTPGAPLFALAAGMIAVSRDAGTSFQSVATTLAAPGGRWGSVSFDPASPASFTVVWVEAPNDSRARSHVLVTGDGGATFTERSAGFVVNGDDLYAASYGLLHDRKRPGTVYACAEDGVYRSTDAGASWVRAVTGVPATGGLSCRRLLVTEGDGHLMFLDRVAGRTSFYVSTDGAASWQPGRGITVSGDLGEAVRDFVVHPTEPKTLYLGLRGSAGVVRTTTLGL